MSGGTEGQRGLEESGGAERLTPADLNTDFCQVRLVLSLNCYYHWNLHA